MRELINVGKSQNYVKFHYTHCFCFPSFTPFPPLEITLHVITKTLHLVIMTQKITNSLSVTRSSELASKDHPKNQDNSHLPQPSTSSTQNTYNPFIGLRARVTPRRASLDEASATRQVIISLLSYCIISLLS